MVSSVIQVKRGASPPQRPVVPISACPDPLHAMLDMCWDEHPVVRITFSRVREMLQKILGKSGDNIIEHLINRMDQYGRELEAEGKEIWVQVTTFLLLSNTQTFFLNKNIW